MQKRLLNPLAALGLSLSLGVFAASSAHAEPEKTDPRKTDASAESGPQSQAKEGSPQTKQLSVRNVTLPEGEEMGPRQQETRADTAGPKGWRPNRQLAIASTGVFAAGYLPAFVVAMANSKGTSGGLYAPVVGPWIEIGKDTSPGNRALLAFSGVLQGVGFIGVVSSFFIPESRTEKMPMVGSKKVSMTPAAGRGTYQLVAHGRF